MIWKPHATVAVIVTQDDCFLLVEEDSDGKVVFNQPAGHIEKDERIVDAACRETLEETGWEVTLEHFLGVYTYCSPSNGETYYRLCFSGSPVAQLSTSYDKEIIAVHWLRYDEILERHAQLRSPLVLKCIDDYRAGRRLPLEAIWESAH